MTDQNHARLMDNVYRNQRFIYDASRKYYLLGRDRLIEDLDVPDGGSVLEIACGTGRNLVRVGKVYPTASLYGLDISSKMLATAEVSLKRSGLWQRTSLANADACDFDPHSLFDKAQFDRIFLSYSLSMIPDWERALAEALEHLVPGGRVSFVDFGLFSGYPAWFGRAMNGWLQRFHVTPRSNVEDVVAALAHKTGAEPDTSRIYRDYALLGSLKMPSPLTEQNR